MKQIKAYLDQLATISETDWDFFMSKLERRVIPKKTVFLKINEIENHISFIEFGVVRLYIPKDNPQKKKSPLALVLRISSLALMILFLHRNLRLINYKHYQKRLF